MLAFAVNTQPAKSQALLDDDDTETILSIQPEHVIAPIGATFFVNVTITNVMDLYSYGFRLRFNPSVIDLILYTSDIITIDTWYSPWLMVTKGWWSGGIKMTAGAPKGGIGVNGSGTIAQIRFTVVGSGWTSIIFDQSWWTFGLWDSNGDEIPYTTKDATFKMGLPITIDIDPNTLNSKSKGKWITAYIELPEGYSASNIDVSTVELNGEISAELHPTGTGDYDTDGITDLMVKFDRRELIALLNVDEATLTITGKIAGIPFEGNDTIKVIDE